MKTPSAFYSMFGALGGATSADFAMEAFEDDVKVASRSVSQAGYLLRVAYLAL